MGPLGQAFNLLVYICVGPCSVHIPVVAVAVAVVHVQVVPLHVAAAVLQHDLMMPGSAVCLPIGHTQPGMSEPGLG